VVRILAVIPIYSFDAYYCLHQDDSVKAYGYRTIRVVYEPVMLVSFVQLLLAVTSPPVTMEGSAVGLAQKMLGLTADHEGDIKDNQTNDRDRVDMKDMDPGFHGIMSIWKYISLPVHRSMVPHLLLNEQGPERNWFCYPVDEIVLWKYHFWPDFICATLIGILQYVLFTVLYFMLRMMTFQYGGPESEEFPWIGIAAKFALQVKTLSCGVALFHSLLLALNLQHNGKTLGAVDSISLGGKFLSIYGVVFFVLAQTWVLHLGIIPLPVALYDCHNQITCVDVSWLEGYQERETWEDILLCFEVFFFAAYHWQAYPVEEFNGLAARSSLEKAMCEYKFALAKPDTGHHKAKQNLRVKIRDAKPFLEQSYKCKRESLHNLRNEHPVMVDFDDHEDAANTTVIVRDSILQRALVLEACETAVQGITMEPDFKRCTCFRQFCKTVFGFMYIIRDIQKLRMYKRNCRQALETLLSDRKLDAEEFDKLWQQLDADKDTKVYKYEINILFHRILLEKLDVPNWIEDLFKDRMCIDKDQFKGAMDRHYAELAEKREIGHRLLLPPQGEGDPTAPLQLPLLQ